ncbi:MAG: nucleotidyltransferase family protein [Anaerolineales bacterium]
MITAIVLAAGLSTRMGRAKPLLPWGKVRVIEHLVTVLHDCPIHEIVVITGHEHEAVSRCLAGWPVQVTFNPDYAIGEMLSSLQVGLKTAATEAEAALIALGDQPVLERTVVEELVGVYRSGQAQIVVPSYNMRRGHPLLIGRSYWDEIVALGAGQTLRDFLRSVGNVIHHVTLNTPSVLQDMDTPDDYQRELGKYVRARET